MDDRTLRVLEFDKVRERLARMTTYPPARERVERLVPTRDLREVEEWQEETEQATHLLALGVDLHLAHLSDIRPVLQRAAVGAVLDEEELAAVAETLATARNFRRAICKVAEEASLFRHRFGSLADLQAVEIAIASRLTDERKLRDDASPELRSLRQRLRVAQGRLRTTLDGWVRRASQQGFLQEAHFTVRSGRYVLPVRQDKREGVPGIVHDQSASGATVFIEPAPLVELGNRIRELEAQEQAERRRILARLTRLVSERLTDIEAVVSCLADSDFAAAKARLARHYTAVRPEVAPQGRLVLRGARHPLLEEEQMAGRLEKVVPVDLECEPTLKVLLITGPNTGGKTVTLKTVGLFTLMFQAGLQVPAESGTSLPVFHHVFADIGDEQGIEQSLSTFSSHMSHIVDLLAQAADHSLVLLDELGAGTDPQEGAALAMAILDELVQRGCRTVATTHYGQLKSYAHSRPEMVNASVEFDTHTLAPTYRLQVGLPGRSNALEIGARLGLPVQVIEAARNYMGVQAVHFEELLADIESERKSSTAERLRAQQEREEAEKLRREWESRQRELKEQRQTWLQQARREAEEIVREARRETEEWIARFRRAGAEQWVTEAQQVRERLAQQGAQLKLELAEDAVRESAGKPPGAGFLGQAGAELRPGAVVWISSLQQRGEVVELLAGRAEVVVQVGPMRTVVPRDELRVEQQHASLRSSRAALSKRARAGGLARSPASDRSGHASTDSAIERVATTSAELHLLGMTVDEAIGELDKFLDRARVAGLERVRIIHGKGTGALRRAVATYLAEQPYVSRFVLATPEEGGTGVTVADLS